MTTIDLLIFIFAAIILFGFTFLSIIEEFLYVRRKKLKLISYKLKLPKYDLGSKNYIKIQLKIDQLENTLELLNKYEVK